MDEKRKQLNELFAMMKLPELTDEQFDQLEEKAKREAEEKTIKEEAAKREREKREAELECVRISGLADLEILLEDGKSYRTSDKNGSLSFSPGEFIAEVRLEVIQPRNGDIDTLKATVQFADDAGEIWQSSPFLRPDIFTRCLRESSSIQFCTWPNVSEEWKKSFKSTCLIDGVADLLDSRQRYDLKASENIFVIMEKYQGPAIDIAQLDPRNLVVRIRNLYAEDYDDTGKFLDVGDVPPLCYRMSSSDLLFFNSPAHYYMENNEWWDPDDPKKPIIFTCSGKKTLHRNKNIHYQNS